MKWRDLNDVGRGSSFSCGRSFQILSSNDTSQGPMVIIPPDGH